MKKIVIVSVLIIAMTGNISSQESLGLNGNVGIGTTEPEEKLDIVGDIKTTGSLNINGGTNGSALLTRFVGSANHEYDSTAEDLYSLDFAKVRSTGTGIDKQAVYDWMFNLNQWGDTGYNGNVMTFYRNGNVGVGTTTPKAKLDIAGSLKVAGNIETDGIINIDGGTNESTLLTRFVGSANHEYDSTAEDLYSLDFAKVRSTGTGIDKQAVYDWMFNLNQWGDTGYNGNVMTFYRNGNVGVGTTTPKAKLDIAGSLKVAGNIETDGIINIDGGTNESTLLTRFVGSANHEYDSTAEDLYSLDFAKVRSTGTGIDKQAVYDWMFNLNQWGDTGYNGNVMTFYRNGNVGVGTTAPKAKLDVAGNIKASGIDLYTGNVPLTTPSLMDLGIGDDKGTLMTFRGADSAPADYYLKLDKVRSFLNVGHPQYDWQFNLHNNGNYNGNVMTFYRNGYVGIGTTNPEYKLSVNGTIAGTALRATHVAIGDNNSEGQLTVYGEVLTDSIIVKTNNYADFVFEDDYNLRGLDEVESFIGENGHLPEIPSASEAINKGINVAEMNVKLLQKIEELTLYMIEQNKRIAGLEAALAN